MVRYVIALLFIIADSTRKCAFRDILYELASVGDLPLPQASPAPSQKREREGDSPISNASAASSASSPAPDAPSGMRSIAGSKRLSRDPYAPSHLSRARLQVTQSSDQHQQQQPPTANIVMGGGNNTNGTNANDSFLPLHSDELGRMPLFNVSYPMDQTAQAWTQQPQPQPQVGPPTTAPGLGHPYDPQIASMFTMQSASSSSGISPPVPGASYGEMFGLSPQAAAQPHFGDGMQMAGAPTHAPGYGEGMQPAPGAVEDMSFSDGALAMWSNAPVSFE